MVIWLLGLVAVFTIGRCENEREEQFKVKIDCSKLGPGNYVFGCNPHYWVCINNYQQYELRCHGDLVLDPDENRCNYREKVRLCTDPNLPRTHPYRALEPFSCNGIKDGKYSTGYCDNHYYTCSKGNIQETPCSYQQYFNNQTKKCDSKEKIDECSADKIKTRPLAQLAVSATTNYSASYSPEKVNPAPRPIPRIMPNGKSMRIGLTLPFGKTILPDVVISSDQNNSTNKVITSLPDCSQLPDGLYENEVGKCSNLFWKCVKKSVSEWKCPDGLFFNKDIKQCDFIENIISCGGSHAKFSTTEDVFGTGANAPLMPVLPTQQAISEFNCTGRINGFYIEEPCQSSYVHCLKGKTEVRNCAPGTVFDSSVVGCQSKDKCSTVRLPRGVANYMSPLSSMQTKLLPPTQTTDPDCYGRKDGLYEIGRCQQNYIKCSAGNSIPQTCPMPLVFSNGLCDNLQSCLNPTISSLELDNDTSKTGMLTYGVQAQQYTPPAYQPGQYNPQTYEPSTTEYTPLDYHPGQYNPPAYQPSTTQYTPPAYQPGQYNPPVYQPSTTQYTPPVYQPNQYNPPAYQPGQYNAPAYQPATTQYTPPAYQPGQYNPPAYQPATTKSPPDTWCRQNNKQDGFHAVGCAQYFYACTFGYSQRIACPAGLYYDPSEYQCDNKEQIPVCGGQKPLASAAPQLAQPLAAPNPWCSINHRTDGFYADGCKSYFYTCTAGITTKLNCPIGLFFDPEEKQCTNRDLIVICGGHKPRPTQQSPPEPATPPDLWCKQNYKSDGFYDVGCANYFYSCANGHSIRINCPGGLFYDAKYGECSNREWVEKCGGKRPQAAASPPGYAPPSYSTDNYCKKYNLPDGIHAVSGCNSYFYTCTGGFSNRVNCPVGLYYDPQTQQCDQKIHVPVCGGKRPYPTSTPPTLANPTAPIDYWCQQQNKPDGVYGVGCASYFYSCTGGYSVKINCPTGLYYDSDENACNKREYIAKCGGSAPALTTPAYAPQRIAPLDTFCQKNYLPDGIHAVKGCVSYFYNCVGGLSYRTNCPTGLYYDINIKQCSNKDWVPACGGSRPPPTTPVSLSPTAKPDTYCRDYKLADGLYGVGCNAYFYSCSSGYSTRVICPSNLYFDIEQGQCANREHIKACGGQQPVTTTSTPYQAYPTVAQDTFCKRNSLPDGLHAVQGCVNYYYNCVGGLSYRTNCPSGLYYDVDIKQCSNKNWVPACGGSRPLPTTPVSLNPAVKPDTYCRNYKLADGLYGVGCSGYFYSCSGGYSTRVYCPSNLYFDIELGQCTNHEHIKACGGQKPVTTTPIPYQSNPIAKDTFCSSNNFPDGIHGNGCKNYFYACSNGYSIRMNCAANTYYDPETQQCDNRERIPACGGYRVTTSASLSAAYANPANYLRKQISLYLPKYADTQPDTWCQQNKKPNGLYADGCSNHFYACNEGTTTRMTCPVGLVFIEAQNECNQATLFAECSERKPTTLLSVINPPEPKTQPDTWCQQYYKTDGLYATGCATYFYSCSSGTTTRLYCPYGLYYDPDLKQCAQRDSIKVCGGKKLQQYTTLPPPSRLANPTPPKDTWCQKNYKTNGFYAVGCASYFYTCSNGYSTKINCPVGLYYDPDKNECNVKEYIPVCGGHRPQVTPAPLLNPTTPVDPFCTKNYLPDGIHAVQGCANYYYTCTGGFSNRITCPTGLYYDAELKQCSYRNLNPKCGGHRPIPNTAVAPQLYPAAPLDTWCQQYKKPDGLHGIGCANYFYSCSGGISNRMQCPNGLYFDVEKQECANREFIPACGGKRAPIITVKQQQPPKYYPTTTNSWCKTYNKEDGIYADKGCNNYFYMCTAGITTTIACPSGLYYDEDLQQCNNKYLVIACGGKKPALQAPYQTPSQQYVPQYAKPPAQTTEQHAPQYAQPPAHTPEQHAPQYVQPPAHAPEQRGPEYAQPPAYTPPPELIAAQAAEEYAQALKHAPEQYAPQYPPVPAQAPDQYATQYQSAPAQIPEQPYAPPPKNVAINSPQDSHVQVLNEVGPKTVYY